MLKGETALVTGAASNIGMAAAQLLAREGARVLLTDVNAEQGEAVASELRVEGCDAKFMLADLAEGDGAASLARRAVDHLGQVSIFVHSASPARVETDTIFNVSDESFDRMIHVNLKSGFVLGRNLGLHMRDRALRGRMVFVTSLHTSTPRNLPHYSTAKAGQGMLVKELAKAMAPFGIRVNAVAPGAVMGGGFQLPKEREAALCNMIPMQRTGLPQEVAQAVLFLVAERFSSYVTGSTLTVDGGLALHNWIAPPDAT